MYDCFIKTKKKRNEAIWEFEVRANVEHRSGEGKNGEDESRTSNV